MKSLALMAMGAAVVLLLGFAQLSPVDVEQNARLDALETWRATLDTPPQYAEMTITPTLLWEPTPEIDIAPTATPAPMYHRATATATVWIRPTPTSAATGRVFRGQVVDVDPLSCTRANVYTYVRLVAVDLQPRAGWIAAGYLEPGVCEG